MSNKSLIIETKGIHTDDFFMPPFTLNKGEIIILNLFGGQHFYETQMYLKNILTGKEWHENITIHKPLTFVEYFRESSFRRIFYPTTVDQYLKKNANQTSPFAKKIYEIKCIKYLHPFSLYYSHTRFHF